MTVNKIKIERHINKNNSLRNFERVMKLFSIAIIISMLSLIVYLMINTDQHHSSYRHQEIIQKNNQNFR